MKPNFTKPSGTEIYVNDNSFEHAVSIGWTPKGLEKKDDDKKKNDKK